MNLSFYRNKLSFDRSTCQNICLMVFGWTEDSGGLWKALDQFVNRRCKLSKNNVEDSSSMSVLMCKRLRRMLKVLAWDGQTRMDNVRTNKTEQGRLGLENVSYSFFLLLTTIKQASNHYYPREGHSKFIFMFVESSYFRVRICCHHSDLIIRPLFPYQR